MSRTRKIPEKFITHSSNKEHILGLLANCLKTEGLEGDAIKPVIPGVEQSKSQIVAALKMLGTVGNFVAELSQTNNRVYESFTATLDSVSYNLYERYDQEWARRLLEDTEKTAGQIEGFVINSHRLLIAEIFNRLMIQALRSDNRHTLPLSKTRSVWIDIMVDFAAAILDEKLRDAVHLTPEFRSVVADMIKKWIPSLQEVVARLEDLERGSQVISENIWCLEQVEMQAARHLICALANERQAAGSWDGVLNSRRMLFIKLAEVEKNWLEEHRGGQYFQFLDLRTPVIELREEKDDKKEVVCSSMDLIAINQQTEEAAKIQLEICQLSNNQKIKNLYGLLNRARLLIQLLSETGEMMNFFIWMPELLERLPFEKLDNFLGTLIGISVEMTQNEDFPLIHGTKLYNQMLLPDVKSVKLKLNKMHKFAELKSSAWIDRVKAHGMATVEKIITLGQANQCEIIPLNFKKKMKKALPERHELRARIELEEQERALVLAQQPTVYSPLVAQDSFFNHEMKTCDLKIKAYCSWKNFSIGTPYLVNYLKSRKILDKFNFLYSAFRNNEYLDFIFVFENADNYFEKPRKFSTVVRHYVLMKEKELIGEKGVAVYKSKKDSDNWLKNVELVLLLKFLCVESVFLGDESYLTWFVEYAERMSASHSKEVADLLRNLVDKLALLMSSEYDLYSQPRTFMLTLSEENKRLKKAEEGWREITVDKMMQLQTKEEEVKVLHDDVSSLKKENEKKDKEIAQLKELLRQREESIQQRDEVARRKDELIQKKEEVIKKKDELIDRKEDVIEEMEEFIQENKRDIQSLQIDFKIEKDEMMGLLKESEDVIRKKDDEIKKLNEDLVKLVSQHEDQMKRLLQDFREDEEDQFFEPKDVESDSDLRAEQKTHSKFGIFAKSSDKVKKPEEKEIDVDKSDIFDELTF